MDQTEVSKLLSVHTDFPPVGGIQKFTKDYAHRASVVTLVGPMP